MPLEYAGRASRAGIRAGDTIVPQSITAALPELHDVSCDDPRLQCQFGIFPLGEGEDFDENHRPVILKVYAPDLGADPPYRNVDCGTAGCRTGRARNRPG